MNREIKFRAWDEVNKEMVYPKIIKESFSSLSSGDILNRYENIMQFTGLKDRNGTEIYEGDILSTPKGISIVTYEIGCFYVKTVSFYRLGGWNTNSIEVIGNIYQNPELLNNK